MFYSRSYLDSVVLLTAVIPIVFLANIKHRREGDLLISTLTTACTCYCTAATATLPLTAVLLPLTDVAVLAFLKQYFILMVSLTGKIWKSLDIWKANGKKKCFYYKVVKFVISFFKNQFKYHRAGNRLDNNPEQPKWGRLKPINPKTKLTGLRTGNLLITTN